MSTALRESVALSIRRFREPGTRRAGSLLLLLLSVLVPVVPARGQEASTSLYVRNDNDRTTVITPRLRVKAPVGERTSAQVVYSVDVWTSASIDIRTSASVAVTEQRDEIDLTLDHELDLQAD